MIDGSYQRNNTAIRNARFTQACCDVSLFADALVVSDGGTISDCIVQLDGIASNGIGYTVMIEAINATNTWNISTDTIDCTTFSNIANLEGNTSIDSFTINGNIIT